MQHPDDASKYPLRFFYGIMLGLIGTSMQSLGLCLWKLHSTWHCSKTTVCVETVVSSCEAEPEAVLLVPKPPEQRDAANHDYIGTPEPVSGGDLVEPASTRKEGQATVTKYNCVLDCRKFSWIWLIGFGLFCLGNVCDFIALGITPLSVVTLLGSWSLVVSPVAAHFLLHEVVTAYDIVSIVLIIVGILLTVMSTGHAANEWPLQRLITHYQEPKVVVLLVGMAVVVFACLGAMRLDWCVRRRKQELQYDTALDRPSKRIRTLYVVVGSVVGNFTALFGKAFSGLLVFTISGQDEFNDPFVGLIIVVFVVSLPLQVYLINASLAVNDILYHMPNFYVFWNIGNIVTGAVFYDEKAHFSEIRWLKFLVGVALLFLGVLFTNFSFAQKQQYDVVSCRIEHADPDGSPQKHEHKQVSVSIRANRTVS